ncbi:hypothetical protein [Nesterenkonia suensis]
MRTTTASTPATRPGPSPTSPSPTGPSPTGPTAASPALGARGPRGGGTAADARPAPDLYRAGAPFSSAELQALTCEGALRHVIADVYAASTSRPGPALRARAARLLLPAAVAEGSVLCGESAAWIQLGGVPGPRLTLISSVFRRGRAAGAPAWQVHQIELSDREVCRVSDVAVTTAARTAADLFLGVGATDSRRSLDLLAWESVHARRPEAVSAAEAPDPAWLRRWWLLADLLEARSHEVDTGMLTALVLERVQRQRHDPDRLDRIRRLIDQCASRRRPTVR